MVQPSDALADCIPANPVHDGTYSGHHYVPTHAVHDSRPNCGVLHDSRPNIMRQQLSLLVGCQQRYMHSWVSRPNGVVSTDTTHGSMRFHQ